MNYTVISKNPPEDDTPVENCLTMSYSAFHFSQLDPFLSNQDTF